MPAYAVYRVESMTGTTFTAIDIPTELTLVGCCEAVNGDAARREIMGGDNSPVLVLRMNTIEHHALKTYRHD